MAKGIYVGVDGAARKVKKAYIGVEGFARKVKKAYIGVGGVARPVFSGGELVYYGSSEDGAVEAPDYGSYTKSTEVTGGTVGNFALFAGGIGQIKGSGSPVAVGTVIGYDRSLTTVNATGITGRYGFSAASMGDFLAFDGGFAGVSASSTCTVNDTDVYNASLTKSRINSNTAKAGSAGTALKKHFMFAGGCYKYNSSSTYSYTNSIRVYNSDLTEVSNGLRLNGNTVRASAVSIGNYAIFAGGNAGSADTDKRTAYAVSDVLTLLSIVELSAPRSNMATATIANYALLGGGSERSSSITGYSRKVDIYDSSLTKMSLDIDFNTQRGFPAGTSIGDYAIFCGSNRNATNQKTTEIYDSSLTHLPSIDSPVALSNNIGAASLNDFALFDYSGSIVVYSV